MKSFKTVNENGIFFPNQPNFVSHDRNVSIKKGYTVSLHKGLRGSKIVL